MSEPTSRRWRARPESWWWISLVVLVPVAVLTGIAALVLATTTHPASAGDQIDLVRTALSVGAGTGGVVALILAGRRQWHVEQAQQATQHDATQRRITELYTKAADQLGADEAPVRLAGLYALERLAQDNPGQRQTIVNVLCAYLRMPYTPPADEPPADDAPETEQARFERRTQEGQVRLTAQRILTAHLRPGSDPKSPVTTFWPDVELDLTGASLTDFDLAGCVVGAAGFANATLTRSGRFNGVTFTGDVTFEKATFTDLSGLNAVSFEAATFAGKADFTAATFADQPSFRMVRFIGNATFSTGVFPAGANFTGAGFAAGAYLQGATFGRTTHFTGVMFGGQTLFAETSFASIAAFNSAHFVEGVVFRLCTFAGPAYFMNASFTMGVSFDRAVFTDAADFENATFTLGNRPGTSAPWMILDKARFARGVPPELARFG